LLLLSFNLLLLFFVIPNYAVCRWFADATMPRNLVWYIVGNWIAQYQNDIFIWENKKFLKSPMLVKGDGPMNKQRRWFKQFYAAQQADAKDATMEW
jgi:hypothetical protein